MGPALLPPGWMGPFLLGASGLLSLLLGGPVRRATGHWGATLLWLGWLLAAVQWAWAWGTQPSGLAYWLAGLLLGTLGAALVRPQGPAPTAEAGPVLHADPWTTPLETPLETPPGEQSAALLGQPALSPEWTVLLASPEGPVQGGRPVWAQEQPTVAAPQEAAGHSWTVPLAGAPASAPEAQAIETPAHWRNQTWWATEDEPVSPLGAPDWAEAEAILEQERPAAHSSRPAARHTPLATARQHQGAEAKEEIEDRQ